MINAKRLVAWRHGLAAATASACLLGVPGSAQPAADAPAGVRGEPDEIRQEDPSFLVAVDVDRPDRTYREGDPLTLRVRSERDAHLHVLYRQSDGKVFQIFPNAGQRDGRIVAGSDVVIPEEKDTFRWTVGPPFGRETIKVIATERPLEPLAAPDLFQGRFNPVPAEKVAAARSGLVEADPRGWAEAVVEITTAPRPAPPPPRPPARPPTERRVGVFIGIGAFAFDEYHELQAESALELEAAANDARVMADVMAARCGITDKLVLTDAQATREAIRAAVCDWLPARSRPGDVVVFFLSSHGAQTTDHDGDEKDGKDEWLIVNDTITLSAFVEFAKRDAAGRLAGPAKAAFERLLAGMRPEVAANRLDLANLDQVRGYLARHTGITDDQFGHWLQRLSGRRVVVILDTCHSGGFAVGEKSLPKPAPAEFDFLDAELGRLKDLGQPDSAMLAACGAQEVAESVRISDSVLADIEGTEEAGDVAGTVKLGVLAYELSKAVTSSPGITLGAAVDRCREGTARYFERFNALRREAGLEPVPPHEPRFHDFLTRPLVLSISTERDGKGIVP